MSYKVDTLIAMMDEVLMRLDHIERKLTGEDVKFFSATPTGKTVGKPVLSIVKAKDENIVDFKKTDI
jgi:hypothetical protein